MDHPIVFLGQIIDKNQNPHFRNIFKEVSSIFSMYHFKRTTRKKRSYYVAADRADCPCLLKRKRDNKGVYYYYFFERRAVF